MDAEHCRSMPDHQTVMLCFDQPDWFKSSSKFSQIKIFWKSLFHVSLNSIRKEEMYGPASGVV